MQIVIPPGQSLRLATAYLSLSRAEADGLVDALNLMLSTGSSGWHAHVSWGDRETDVTLLLEAERGPRAMPDEMPAS